MSRFRFSLILCGILVVIGGIGSMVTHRLSHSGLSGLPWLGVADIILGLFIIVMALSTRRH